MKHGKSAALLLTGILIGGVLAGPVVGAAAEKLSAERSAQAIYVDGRRVTMETYTINGSNYVKLRDVGKALNFNVYWDGSVQVQSNAPYTGEAPAAPAKPAQSGTSSADAGENAAISAALSHAGVKKTDATHLRAELGYENGRRVYEVEFHVGRTEYSYGVDAASLEIISSDKEVD